MTPNHYAVVRDPEGRHERYIVPEHMIVHLSREQGYNFAAAMHQRGLEFIAVKAASLVAERMMEIPGQGQCYVMDVHWLIDMPEHLLGDLNQFREQPKLLTGGSL